MSGCECCISAKIMHPLLLSWRDIYLNKLKDLSQNIQNRRSGEMSNRLFETYKNSVMPHGHHIYETASDMFMETICAYPPSQHELVVHCCADCPRVDLPDK